MVGIIVAALAGIAGGVTGWAVALGLTLGIAAVLGVTDADGSLSMMAAFTIGPIGAMLGIVAGTIVALRRVTGGSGVVARLPLVVLVTALIAAITGWIVWDARLLTASNALPPELVFELRLPPGGVAPALVSRDAALARRSPILLETSENEMAAEITAVRVEAGRAIVTGRVELAYRVSQRRIVYRPAGGEAVQFDIALGRSPAPTSEFGPWHAEVGGGGHEIRTRVVAEG